MLINRRAFTAGALGTAFAAATPLRAAAFAAPAMAGALDAIRAYAEDHRRTFNLPGLTLGLAASGGTNIVFNTGFANPDARLPISPDTLFQIGSISKSLTSALIHQLAAEGRLRLTDPMSTLMPELPLPRGNGISVQHLLDHVSGLPDDAPMFVEGGLWLGYRPGEHWSYSNTGYGILGKLAEHVAGKPLNRLLEERIFRSLGMTRSRGAIVGPDRARFAQGYEAADMTGTYARGAPLAPAGWVDVTDGAGSIASTASDMILYMRSLADAAQGRGGFGLGPVAGRAFTTHFVATDSPAMRYGNGLMQISDEGRSYLHHTGGMVSFSSAFHVDPVSGFGAFASSSLSGLLGYRPRKLSLFAAKALTAAAEGRPLPAPPPLIDPIKQPGDFVGRYRSANRNVEVRGTGELVIIAGGKTAPLQPVGANLFVTPHPDFTDYALMFERTAGRVGALSWGPETLLRDGTPGTAPKSDPALARLAGRYVNDSPWLQTLRIVERGGKLWAGTDAELHPLGPNRFRLGNDAWSPERVGFANFFDGRPQTLIFSGEKFLRHDN
ncbi:MAG: serine hydrolase domain-containing protein [Sphingomicrobium sp.]